MGHLLTMLAFELGRLLAKDLQYVVNQVDVVAWGIVVGI